jgi:Holliday junction DNA helicase RuvA
VIAQLKGTLIEKGIDQVVVDVGGVGLRLTVSLQTLAELPATGSPVQLVTHLQVREDALTLFGFGSVEERAAFELCIGVQQVGPKLAMSILSTFTPGELAQAVRGGDHARLQRIPGVGKKTAERLALELRDKFDKAGIGPRAPSVEAAPAAAPRTEAVVSALVNLGYRLAEAQKAVDEVAATAPGGSVPELIKKALRALAE